MRGASEYRRMAREALSGNWGIALAVSLVALILGAISNTVSFTFDVNDLNYVLDDGALNIAAVLSRLGVAVAEMLPNLSFVAFPLAGIGIVRFIIGGSVELGHNMFYIGLMRREEPKFATLFSRMEMVLKALGLRLFMDLFIVLWSFLLVVPGIIASYRYRLAPYLMAEHPEMGIREAVNESKRLTEGYKSRWFWLDMSFIGWLLLVPFTLGIGLLWLNPYMQAASASFYLDIMYPPESAPVYGGGNGEPEFVEDGPERI